MSEFYISPASRRPTLILPSIGSAHYHTVPVLLSPYFLTHPPYNLHHASPFRTPLSRHCQPPRYHRHICVSGCLLPRPARHIHKPALQNLSIPNHGFFFFSRKRTSHCRHLKQQCQFQFRDRITVSNSRITSQASYPETSPTTTLHATDARAVTYRNDILILRSNANATPEKKLYEDDG